MVSVLSLGESGAGRGVAPDGVDRELAPDKPVQAEAVADDAVDPLGAGSPKDVDHLPGQGRVAP
jgi:hypothetical protein